MVESMVKFSGELTNRVYNNIFWIDNSRQTQTRANERGLNKEPTMPEHKHEHTHEAVTHTHEHGQYHEHDHE